MKNFCIFIVIFFSSNLFAEYQFKYKDVYACSPKKFEFYHEIQGDFLNVSETFIIHFSDDGDHFSIFTNGLEFSSFKKIDSTQLLVQSGGIRWLEFQDLGSSMILFKLNTINTINQLFHSNLLFNKKNKSAFYSNSWSEYEVNLPCWNFLNKD